MKYLLFASALSLSMLHASGQSSLTLQSTTYTIDTISHFKAGPATTHTELRGSATGTSFKAHILKIDLSASNHPQIKVEVGRDSCNTAETVSSLGTRKSNKDKRYIAGINGDFFITSGFQSQWENAKILGFPNMSSATLGQMISPDAIDQTSRENALVITSDYNMWIDATDLSGTFSVPGKPNPISFAHTNFVRADNQIIIYNSFAGKYTSTDAGGCEVAVSLDDGETWGINRPIHCHVVTPWSETGCMQIPQNGAVISAGKSKTSAIDWLKKLNIGDEVIINHNLSLPTFNISPLNVTEIIGGDVRILKEGVTQTTENSSVIRWINTPTARYPRTAVGYSENRNNFMMVTIDGKGAGGSNGLTYYELADFMRSIGCYDALDLDGGGSTEMWLKSNGIINTLSDGAERAVGNSLFAVVNAPESSEILSISFYDHIIRMPLYGVYSPTILGYNSNEELLDLNVNGCSLSCNSRFGKIDNENNSVMAIKDGSFVLTATKAGMSTNVLVEVIKPSGILCEQSSLLLDDFHSYDIKVMAVANGKRMPISPEALVWTSSHPEILSVDNHGHLSVVPNHPASDQPVKITGKIDDQTINIDVTLQTAIDKVIQLPSLSRKETWTVKTSGVSNFNINDGLRMSWNISNTRSAYIQLTPADDADAILFGLPDFLNFDATMTGATPFKSIKITFDLPDGNRPSATFAPIADASPMCYRLNFSETIDTSDIATAYPIKIRQIYIDLTGFKTGVDYVLGLENFSTEFLHSILAVDNIFIDSQGYNDTEPIELYDIFGRKVAMPQPGSIYIKKQGTKIRKFIAR